MILYTMMPQDLIFPVNEEETAKEVMLSYKGIPIIAEWEGSHDYRVIRVLSSDLKDYMEPSCQPGSKISLLSSH
ncbi:YlzJ-like family protein [Bacillus sp. REN3]|uniref:YlzJ-like family protein n=1 Tax=Bacillus sp. REN3 TaxID=2802440 RepID=UPI001AEEAB3D|nr:YlzJ-like family protein [Bacillus sp. REN3]